METSPDALGRISHGTSQAAASPDGPGRFSNRIPRPATSPDVPVRIAQPSGLTVVGASVRRLDEGFLADQATVYRTARRLMESLVYLRAPTL